VSISPLIQVYILPTIEQIFTIFEAFIAVIAHTVV
jgi:hypothetical protein